MSTSAGRAAEDLAAGWLYDQGYKIVQRNWRNRWAEIDIVAFKSKSFHFVEVKYRRGTLAGTGIEAITYDKSRRLRRAAAMWMQSYGTHNDYQIDVMAISGFPEPKYVDFLPNAVVGN